MSPVWIVTAVSMPCQILGSWHVTAYIRASNTCMLRYVDLSATRAREYASNINGLEHGYDVISELAYSVPLFC